MVKFMKTIPDFELELKAIDDGFDIKINPHHLEMAGVYWQGIYCFAVPGMEIYDEVKNDYVNSVGLRHRTRPEALALAKNYLQRLKHEKGFVELMKDETIFQ